MEFILLWIFSVITTNCMMFANKLKMLKDIADEGYKINEDKTHESNILGDTIFSKVLKLIPIINVFYALYIGIKICSEEFSSFDTLKGLDALEMMNMDEMKEYMEEPTGFNAYMIAIRSILKIEGSHKIIINNELGKSTIFYSLDNNDIEIIKVVGPASQLNEYEQKELVIDTMENLRKAIEEQFGGQENFIKALEENGDIKIRCDVKENEKEKTIEQSNEVYENINNQQIENKEEDGPRLTKKLK